MSDSKRPPGLSAASTARFVEMTSAYEFTTSEHIALVEHLIANDRAVKYERDGQPQLAQKERQAAFRWYKSLKFSNGAARKPGRPPDQAWSAQRGQRAS